MIEHPPANLRTRGTNKEWFGAWRWRGPHYWHWRFWQCCGVLRKLRTNGGTPWVVSGVLLPTSARCKEWN